MISRGSAAPSAWTAAASSQAAASHGKASTGGSSGRSARRRHEASTRARSTRRSTEGSVRSTGDADEDHRHAEEEEPGVQPQSAQEDLWSKCVLLGFITLNAAAAGLTVDVDDIAEFEYILVVFLVAFYLELLGRWYLFGFISCVKDVWICLDVLFLLVSTVGWFLPKGGGQVLRYTTLFRFVRVGSILRHSKEWRPLRDLWLVLGGIHDAAGAFLWFVFMVFAIVYPCGGAVTVLLRGVEWSGLTLTTTLTPRTPLSSNNVAEYVPEEYCLGTDFRSRIDCIDLDEYFGSTSRSSLSLLQIATYDRWASSIVRPLLNMDALTAWCLIGFVVVVGFLVINVAAALFVYATVELARTHADHESQRSSLADTEIISSLGNFFAVNLKMEDRASIDFLELKEAMNIPELSAAFKQLDLPVTEPWALFTQLDKHNHGKLSVEEFQTGLLRLKEPATRVDYARLAALLGGKVTYMDGVDARTEDLRRKLHETAESLSFAMEQLGAYTDSPGVSEWLPEVPLRAQGRMQSAKELNAAKQGRSMYTY